MARHFTFGVIVNPLAGVGGPLGWKGSDDRVAVLKHANACFPERAGQRFLKVIAALHQAASQLAINVSFKVASGWMGYEWLKRLDAMPCVDVVCSAQDDDSFPTPDMFRDAVRSITRSGVDLLVFVGGDGTARLVVDGLTKNTPVLGVPAGVKMHSGVFAVSVDDAIASLTALMRGEITQLSARQVRDLDEEQYRQGHLATRLYGELWVPGRLEYIQATKVAGRENDDLVKVEIGAYCADHWIELGPMVIGPGTTTLAVKHGICGDGTLLGIDLIDSGRSMTRDVNEEQLWTFVQQESCSLVLGVTGCQGMLLGRGNQQLSSRILNMIAPERRLVVATKAKLTGLEQSCLRVDVEDDDIRERWTGVQKVLVGYDDWVMVSVR